MEYKISYRQTFGQDGTHYDQKIRVAMTLCEFVKLNERINTHKRADANKWFHLNNVHLGANSTTLTTSRFVAEFIGAQCDTRFKADRNTIVETSLSNWDKYLCALCDNVGKDVITLYKVGETYVSTGIARPFKLTENGKLPTWANIDGWIDEDGHLRSLTWFDQSHLYELGITAARQGVTLRVVGKEHI